MIPNKQSISAKFWWLLGLVLFCVFLLVQLPAYWLVQKFVPESPYLQQVSGNIWQGQANWQLPVNPNSPLTGIAKWQWQPWYLLLGKVGMTVQIETGKSQLTGQVKIASQDWQLNDVTGKISQETLQQLKDWQMPDSAIVVEKFTLASNQQGFYQADGHLSWAGGEMGYPNAGKLYKINLPKMQGKLALLKNNQSENTPSKLHLALTNQQGQHLGDIYLDHDKMLDIGLTQRLLKHMPEYKGQGADDTVVVSLRQPLSATVN